MVQAALPGGLLRAPFVRFDLRLHRKIVVIDGHTGFIGGINVADRYINDPKYRAKIHTELAAAYYEAGNPYRERFAGHYGISAKFRIVASRSRWRPSRWPS